MDPLLLSVFETRNGITSCVTGGEKNITYDRYVVNVDFLVNLHLKMTENPQKEKYLHNIYKKCNFSHIGAVRNIDSGP